MSLTGIIALSNKGPDKTPEPRHKKWENYFDS